MPQVKPKVKLLQYTPVPENLVSMAARLCYSQSDLEALEARVEQRDQTAFIKKVTGMGHLSVIEHAAFTASKGCPEAFWPRLPATASPAFRFSPSGMWPRAGSRASAM